ncbi:hypothetical protein BDV06DRAFT_204200 [Aspergillus oleicola]
MRPNGQTEHDISTPERNPKGSHELPISGFLSPARCSQACQEKTTRSGQWEWVSLGYRAWIQRHSAPSARAAST